MSSSVLSIRERTRITSTTISPLQVEHARWTAKYRLNEQLQRNGDFDLRRTLLNANLLDNLDEWQTRHPYVRPAPVVLPQPSSTIDSSSPPPVMVRDFAAASSEPATTTTPSSAAIEASDNEVSLDLFYDTYSDSEESDEEDLTLITSTDDTPHRSDSLTSASSLESSDDDVDDWDSEYHSEDAHYDLSLNGINHVTLDDHKDSSEHVEFVEEPETVDADDDLQDDEDDEGRVAGRVTRARLTSPPPLTVRKALRPTLAKAVPKLKSKPGWMTAAAIQARVTVAVREISS